MFSDIIHEPIFWFRIITNRSSHRMCSVKKGVRNFTKFTRKHLCQRLFFFNSFVISPGLIKHDTGRLENEAFTSNPIVSSKQKLSGLKTTNCNVKQEYVNIYYWEVDLSWPEKVLITAKKIMQTPVRNNVIKGDHPFYYVSKIFRKINIPYPLIHIKSYEI